jgi:hypothetical protein
MRGPYPATELAYTLFTEAVANGLGELGTQGFINLFKTKKASDCDASTL